jgi:hypothetical protein
MAMNGNILGIAMLAAIDDVVAQPGATGEIAAMRRAIWQAIGREIVEHVQANAQVTVTVTSVTGVTVGAGVSGPGTGTGTIT